MVVRPRCANWLIAFTIALLAFGCRNNKNVPAQTEIINDLTPKSVIYRDFERDFSVSIREVYVFPGSNIAISVDQVDRPSNRVFMRISDTSTGEVESGWVSVGRDVQFAPKLFGTRGLGVESIGDQTVTLIERWGTSEVLPATRESAH